jgi:hypothetical protein
MISNHAREGFDHLLKQGLKDSLVASPEDTCEITVVPDLSRARETKTIILTISSYVFRSVVLMHFSPDHATKEHFARINKVSATDMSEQAFHDAVAERGNLCCGTLNRELARFFPHIGMSTPNVIDKECTTYLGVLGSGHIQHFRVDINSSVHFHASLCVCDYANIDFVLEAAHQSSGAGELELF